MLLTSQYFRTSVIKIYVYIRAALKVLHDVQKPIVDVGVINKLNLDLVQITQRILYTVSRVQTGLENARTLRMGCWPWPAFAG